MEALKNTRHERVVLNLLDGMPEYEAYIKAGFAVKGARANASRLIAKDNIKARLAYLKTQVATRAVSKKEQKLLVLERIFNQEPFPEEIKAKDRVFAISEHNRMTGDSVPSPGEGVVIIQTAVFILPDGTKVTPKQLLEGNNATQQS